MEKIVDIILDKLNNNTLYTDKIFGFLAYYYDNELKGNKKNDKCIENYKQEIENIFLERSNNPTFDLPKKARNLAIEVVKNIKSKDLPQIADKSIVFFKIAIILMCLWACASLELVIFHNDDGNPLLVIVFFALSIVFLNLSTIIRKGLLASLLESRNISSMQKKPEKIKSQQVTQNKNNNQKKNISNNQNKIQNKKQIDKQQLDIYLNNARKYELEGDYSKAIDEYTHAIKLAPRDADIYASRAKCYIHTFVPILAKSDFMMATIYNPSYYDNFNIKVEFYQSIKDYDEVLKLFRTHIEENPKDYDAYCKRASVWIEMEKFEEAIIDLKKAKKYVKDTEKEAQIQRTLDNLKNTAKAQNKKSTNAETKQREVKKEKLTTSKKDIVAEVQQPDKTEQNTKAEQYIKNATDFESQKDYINAINEYTKAISLNPENVFELYIFRAECCMQIQQYKNVVEDCTQAIELSTNLNSNAYYTRGLAYQNLNNKTDAINDIQKAISINPDNQNYRNTLNDLLQNNNTIIDLESCTQEEMQTLECFSTEKAEKFIQERKNGKIWYDIDSFVQDFELQPHEMVMIQDRIKFPEKPKNKYGRKIDI